MIRGGGWYGSAEGCTVAIRYYYYQEYRNYAFGFRVALSSVP